MEAAAILCRRCGLCCDGSLFTSVPLAGDEIEPARRRGLVVITRGDGTPGVRQRCAALADGGCAVYEERPRCCRAYRCMLLTALGDDEVSLDDALVVVAEAHARLAATGDRGAALAWLGRHFERAAGRG